MACGPAGEVLATTCVSMGYSVMMVDCGRDTSTFGYVYGPDWGDTSRSAATIGGSLAMYCSTDAPSPVFFAFDANGNVTDLVATDGNLAAHYDSDPYGNLLVSSGDLAAANPYRFSSKYTNDETGLVYYGTRFYWPKAGRWVSRDPIGDVAFRQPVTIEAPSSRRASERHREAMYPWYLFVGGNTVNGVDLLRLKQKQCQIDIYFGHAAWVDQLIQGVEGDEKTRKPGLPEPGVCDRAGALTCF